MNKRRSRKTKSGRKRRTSKKTRKLKRSFGSMYGLQGGDMHYSGLYPMTMKYVGEMPNLYNVKRDYTVG